ncbi:MaoC family dehydratase [Erythrobacter alti]|uniref:MaoC family dehydratase n=1 Tax=Erythrobacter alti TaxID=1896145 RepID=UPI0030F396DD
MAQDELYLDDLAVGQTFESATHAMDADQIVAFARDYDPQPFHIDAAAAEDTYFRGLAASGWHTAAITMRLLVETMPLANGVIGGGGELRWPSATRADDLLRVTATIDEIVPSRSRPGRGLVVAHCVTLNQNDEIRQEFRPRLVAWKRGVDPQV